MNKIDEARVRLLLGAEDYRLDRVRLAASDTSGFSHVVASRKGLFLVRPGEWRMLLYGEFFGLTLLGTDLLVFQACGLPSKPARLGRIVRLRRSGDMLVGAEVLTRGLDTGCHQMDMIDGRLHVVDTYRQRLLRFSEDGQSWEELAPISGGDGERLRGDDPLYLHINSLLAAGDRRLLLLHGQWRKTGRLSEIAVCDAEWRVLERWPVAGRGCHDLALLEDGNLLVCDSEAGALVDLCGLRVKVSELMLRGLAVGKDGIAVGGSAWAERGMRGSSGGTVTFLNRSYKVESVLEVPGAPTAIRRLDGRDAGLSEYLRQVGRGGSVNGPLS